MKRRLHYGEVGQNSILVTRAHLCNFVVVRAIECVLEITYKIIVNAERPTTTLLDNMNKAHGQYNQQSHKVVPRWQYSL